MARREKIRRAKIRSLSIFTLIIAIISIISFLCYFSSKKPILVTYTEKSNVDYKVYLKENEFYEKDYVDKDNQYISNLVDNIETKFDYYINFF